MYKTKYLHRYLQVSTQMAMDNNPSSKRAGVVFFALRLSYRFSYLIVQMESENQELVVESFPFEQSDLRDDSSNEGQRTRRPPVWMKDYCP